MITAFSPPQSGLSEIFFRREGEKPSDIFSRNRLIFWGLVYFS
jgi:hypothetical protein